MTLTTQHWERVGIKHHHGINLPLFSLHTQNSCGIGEYTDLLPLIDYCKEVGLDVIQLLPINDTGPDASPYNALSAIALHPIYLGLHALPGIQEAELEKFKALNLSKRVEYNKVQVLKDKVLNNYFLSHFKEVSGQAEYLRFVEENSWLTAYALFKAIKEKQQWQAWEKWPKEIKSPSNQHFQELLGEHEERIHFHTFVQYLCYTQMKEVKKKADAAHIMIKGDIPILLSRDSADVWAERHNFHLHLSAGAPPDAYNAQGQSWGFPLYDWHAMEKSGFDFWKNRLKYAEHFYHLYRVDHVVGFFRIWAIPLNKSATLGFFEPADESLWVAQGRSIMEMMLQTTTMLPIGEDLGTVPDSVRATLTDLGIPGTKMMRWERRWSEDGGFIDPKTYPPLSMTTVSTHDSDTLLQWWQHFPKEAKHYCEFKQWSYLPFLSPERHMEILYDAHHSGSLFHINLFQEYLALFPELTSQHLQDERINVPGTHDARNWTYRFRVPLEVIVAHQGLRSALHKIIN